MATRLTLWIMVVLVFATPAAGRADRTRPAIPLAISGDGAVILPVQVDRDGTFRFLLDTGSNRSIVSERVASRLSLEPVAQTSVVTAAGSEIRKVVLIRRVSVGSTGPRDLLASVVASETLTALKGNIDGVLGQDFLLPLDYTLDYKRKRLTWNAGVDCRDRVEVALRHDEGRWLAALPQDARGDMRWLVPDSGASSTVIFRRSAGPHWDLVPILGRTEVVALTGRGEAQPAVLRTLRIGDITLRDLPAVVIDRDGPDAPAGDGLLPLHGFSSVTFSASGSMTICR